jgi:ABC-type multidrug transport system fused ATPase/permease subunit
MLRYRYGKFKCLSNSLSGVAAKLVYIVVFFLTGFLLLRQEITVGTAVAAIGYIECFMSPIQSLLYDFDALNSTKEIKKKVEGYVCADIPSFLKDKKTFASCIEYEDVNISYDNFLIKNFNYKFEKGKKYAIIGHSGSGKSTIINAMLDYTDIVSGKITIDGEEVKNIDTSNIFSTLNQAETVFNDDFINNVTVFGAYDKYKVEDILEKLNCKVTKTIEIKENCATLSGGELKVLFLIRMLLKDTNVCIMDEPFSAMDEKTTNILQKALFKLKDKTIIMITHRLDKDYLEQFDEIILMDSGQITQTGKYKDIEDKIKEIIE